MISMIVGMITGIVGWLNGILPNSPFQDLLTGNNAILTGIGWLNWFIPVGDLLAIFGLYLAALLLWVGVDFALSSAGKSLFGFGGK